MSSTVEVLAWPRDRNRGDNPYTALLYEALAPEGIVAQEYNLRALLRARFDVLHIHWPEGVLRGSVLRQFLAAGMMTTLLLYVRRIRRKNVVWTVHNLKPHAGAKNMALRILRLGLRGSVSGLIFLSRASREECVKILPWAERTPYALTPHGRYGASFTSGRSIAAIRAEFGLSVEDFVVSFVGRLEEYKGPLRLIEAHREATSPQLRTLVAGGASNEDYGRKLEALAESEDHIQVHSGWLTNERMAELIRASDVVAYPYENILNSGSVILPLEFGTRVLAPSIGSIPEVADLVGREWLITYERTLSGSTLDLVVSMAVPEAPPNLGALDWPVIARDTAEFLRALLR